MGINRSGYYKWKARQGQLNRYERDRIVLTELLHEEHKRHPSLGYHRLSLNLLAGKKEEQRPRVVFHIDRGAVYSSRAFQHTHKAYSILRSMSRGGTPTDNPIIEALNGWIKEELYLDFGLNEAENLPDLLNKYVCFFNNQRPAAALGYKSPVQYKTKLGFL